MKNYTKEELQNKKIAEESVFVGNDMLEIPPEWLRDDESIKEWVRLIKEFKKIGTLSNLDYNNLGFYCNTFSRLKETNKRLEKNGMILGRNISTYTKLSFQLSEELRKWSATLGLTAQSRILVGKNNLGDKNTEVADKFGI